MAYNISRTSRKTLVDDIFKTLKEQIVTLRLKPGEMIYENTVAASFGVSRTPIREAINRLQQEELINILQQRGACIAHLSEKKVREAQYIRETLELSAFKIVAQNWNTKDLIYRKAKKDIELIIEEQKEAVEKGEFFDFIDLDAKFHTRILELCDNQTLLHVLKVMRGHLNRMRYLELQEGRHELESVKHHKALLQYLMQNDVENTEKLLLNHLQYIVNDWTNIMRKYADFFE